MVPEGSSSLQFARGDRPLRVDPENKLRYWERVVGGGKNWVGVGGVVVGGRGLNWRQNTLGEQSVQEGSNGSPFANLRFLPCTTGQG